MPDAAALVALLMPELAAPIVLVSQLLFCGTWTFLGAGGTAFFAPMGCEPTGFFTAGALVAAAPTGFFAAGVGAGAFFAPTGVGFLYGTVLVWASPTAGFLAGPTALGPVDLGPAMAFLVPMGWATMVVFQWMSKGSREICEHLIESLKC